MDDCLALPGNVSAGGVTISPMIPRSLCKPFSATRFQSIRGVMGSPTPCSQAIFWATANVAPGSSSRDPSGFNQPIRLPCARNSSEVSR